jgi:hypothetical protein
MVIVIIPYHGLSEYFLIFMKGSQLNSLLAFFKPVGPQELGKQVHPEQSDPDGSQAARNTAGTTPRRAAVRPDSNSPN